MILIETLTIKLNKNEYTNFNDIFDKHDVIILNGARGSGKSYPTAKYISNILKNDLDAKFIYMRNRKDELATFNGWCKDLDLFKLADYPEAISLRRGVPTKGDITLFGLDESGHEISARTIGKCMSLESSHDYKSGKYDEYCAIVFEEYAHRKMHPNNENAYVFNFLENIETVFRNREKKIFLIANNFKNMPLLERAINELVGEKFKNPIKIKIFRKSDMNKTNSFVAYLNGEVYDDDEFRVNVDEFRVLYTNKDFVIKQHKVLPQKIYVQFNKSNKTYMYKEDDFLKLKYFCQRITMIEFYYQSPAVEYAFQNNFINFTREITNYTAVAGAKYII